MNHRFRRCTLLTAFAAVCLAQAPEPATQPPEIFTPGARPSREPAEIKIPGESQRDRILKAEAAENLKEATQMVDLAQQLRGDLEKNGRYVFSIADCKKAEDIEKLAHRIRSRMQHN
jgi:hypothetical protein